MSTISFYIPNSEKEQIINVDVKKLMILHEEIAGICQGLHLATWTDTIIDEIIGYIWGEKPQDFEEYLLAPDYTIEEIEKGLKVIKELSELIKWFPINNENQITFTPLLDALEKYNKNHQNPTKGLIDDYPTIDEENIKNSLIASIKEGRIFSAPLSDGNITKELLLKKGFEEKKEERWFGNGQDYQVSSENGGSTTVEQDFVLKTSSTGNLIVRFEKFSFKEKNKTRTDESISFHYGTWHPKCYNLLPVFLFDDDKYKISHLLLAYKLLTGKNEI